MRTRLVAGDPGGIRTPDPRLRRPLLYPTELLDPTGFSKGAYCLLYHLLSIPFGMDSVHSIEGSRAILLEPQHIIA